MSDTELLPIIEISISAENPRDWYYALMDYGVFLKKEHSNPSRASKHHGTQTTFKGSRRAVRGEIIRQLSQKPCSLAQLKKTIAITNPTRILETEEILQALVAEGFIKKIKQFYTLA